MRSSNHARVQIWSLLGPNKQNVCAQCRSQRLAVICDDLVWRLKWNERIFFSNMHDSDSGAPRCWCCSVVTSRPAACNALVCVGMLQWRWSGLMWEQHETSGGIFLGASSTPPPLLSPSLSLSSISRWRLLSFLLAPLSSHSAALSLRGRGGGGGEDEAGEQSRVK